MLKRAAAYLLSFCIVFSMFVQFVPSVLAQEITPWSNPELYIECEADFATDDKAEPGMAFQSFICVADPAPIKYEDLYASGATALPLVYETEVKDIKVVIKDYYISDDGMLWFKVEAAAGSTMPATLQQNPWVMYVVDEYDFPSLLIEEPQPTATPTAEPTATPTAAPTATPTAAPSTTPTAAPTATPTAAPSATPTAAPSATPTAAPSATPTAAPSATPTAAPSATPTAAPTATPTAAPPQLDPQYQIEEINRKGYFEKENVTFYKNPMGTSDTVTLATADLPQRVDVAYKVTDTGLQTPVSWYLLANTQSWQGIESWQYCYVLVEDVILADDEPETDPAVQQAFERLMATTTVDEFEELYAEIGKGLEDRFTAEQIDQLASHSAAMQIAETITYEKEVMYKGVAVPVTVTGIIPQGLTLSVHPANNEAVLNGGFAVDKAEDIALALDIKLLDADSNEWQPKAGRTVTVSMGVTALGLEDGKIFQLEHKHGNYITRFDVCVVMDGKITVTTNGFSAYVVSSTTSTTQLQGTNEIPTSNDPNNPSVINMQVGETKVFYVDISNDQFRNTHNRPNEATKNVGTWQVTDPEGAVYYEVHSNEVTTTYGVCARWLKITALKETDEPVELVYTYARVRAGNPDGNDRVNPGFEYYALNIDVPDPDAGKTSKLYLKDDINNTGCIRAKLVDAAGNPLSLAGASFEWKRYDGPFLTDADKQKYQQFIMPHAYETDTDVDNKTKIDNASINVARDHGGLLEKQKDDNGDYLPTTYIVTATLADGSVQQAQYTVYYPSEIINANFEHPRMTGSQENSYTFFINGWPDLYWKTTAPGEGVNTTRDIEFAHNSNNNNSFGPTRAADRSDDPPGYQYAEINAENFGALYQDIITAPGEEISWSFAHNARSLADWVVNYNNYNYGPLSNNMYIVMGPTEGAQKIVEAEDLRALTTAAENAFREANGGPMETGDSIEIYYNEDTNQIDNNSKHKYVVWYSSNGEFRMYNNQYSSYEDWYNRNGGIYSEANNYGWDIISGTYLVPENQYRSRVFFVSKPSANDTDGDAFNAGNLIDAARVGQYKTYLIEYYEEIHLDNGVVQRTHRKDLDQPGEALIYSTVPLTNYDKLANDEKDYLSRIYINGGNYPYNIRFPGDESLFIENYPGTATHFDVINTEDPSYEPNNYANYDIVMQVFFTDTMVSASQILQFPAELTDTQKLSIIKDLPDGYQTAINLTDKKPGDTEFCNIDHTFTIKGPDPSGVYAAYTVLGDNHRADDAHDCTEVPITELPGLRIVKTIYQVFHYSKGEEVPKGGETTSYLYSTNDMTQNKAPIIHLKNDGSTIIDSASIVVTNIYEEKQVTVTYEAVGKGKVSWKGEAAPDYKDKPTETVKFYSGDPRGASVHAEGTAVFAGWYKDKECTIPITAADGKYIADEPEAGNTVDKQYDFEPNIHVINEESVTFYAKFVTRSLTVEREVTAADIGQTFVYYIKGSEGSNVDMYITMEVKPEDIKADGTGKISRTIYEVPSGRYDVVQLKDWSWRYDPEDTQFVQHTGTASNELEKTLTFNKPRTIEKWLSGLSEIAHNIGGKGGTT